MAHAQKRHGERVISISFDKLTSATAFGHLCAPDKQSVTLSNWNDESGSL
jgi:hypothetical protein